MKLIIGAVGKMRQTPESSLCNDYLARADKIARHHGFAGPDLKEVEAPKSLSGGALKTRESELLLKALPDSVQIIALDEKGQNLSSAALKNFIVTQRDQGAPALAFLIGGADGHGDPVRQKAVKTFSFGAATWPHMLVRVMLAEQIYRAMTMLAGLPYHRA